MKDSNNINTFDQLIKVEHGKIGTESRNTYEENAQMFIISEMLKEARKEAKITPIARIYNPCPQPKVKGFCSVFLRYLFDRASVK